MKPVKSTVLLCAFMFLLSGCVKLWKDTIDIKTFMVQVEREGNALNEPLAEKLWIEQVHMLPPYNVRSLIVRENDVVFSPSYYSELLMSPSENFQNGFYIWLSDSGIFKQVSMLDRKGMSHRLVATVLDFYLDQPAGQVVLRIKVSLFDETNKDMNVVLHTDYTQTAPVAAGTAENVIRGYNQAFAAILAQLEADLIPVIR